MQLEAHFIKNNDFKTVQCNGAFGGITTAGQINMIIYTERMVVPKSIVSEIDDSTGQTLREVSRETKRGVVREVQFGAVMDINVAKSLVDWLNNQIQVLDSARADLK